MITVMSEYELHEVVRPAHHRGPRLQHLTGHARAPYNHNPSEKSLGGFSWGRLQWVLGTLGKLLLDSLPTLRGQLGDPIVDVLLEINGYESIV